MELLLHVLLSILCLASSVAKGSVVNVGMNQGFAPVDEVGMLENSDAPNIREERVITMNEEDISVDQSSVDEVSSSGFAETSSSVAPVTTVEQTTSSTTSTTTTTTIATTIATSTTTTSDPPAEPCVSRECLRVSKELEAALNRYGDVCSGFKQFACGQYPTNYKIPGGSRSWGTYEKVRPVHCQSPTHIGSIFRFSFSFSKLSTTASSSTSNISATTLGLRSSWPSRLSTSASRMSERTKRTPMRLTTSGRGSSRRR